MSDFYRLLMTFYSTTGQFCDPQLLAWSNQNTLTTNESCSDCWLGVQVLQLANPLGYDPGLASDFASLTSSCNVTAYSYVSPTAYALNTTATTLPATVTATPASSCTGSYTVKSADTCFSVSQALNVSTYSLLYHNNLDIYCQNFNASVGLGLCIPPQCETYTWQALDTCNSVVSDLIGITITQFLACEIILLVIYGKGLAEHVSREPELELFVPEQCRVYWIRGLHWVRDVVRNERRAESASKFTRILAPLEAYSITLRERTSALPLLPR